MEDEGPRRDRVRAPRAPPPGRVKVLPRWPLRLRSQATHTCTPGRPTTTSHLSQDARPEGTLQSLYRDLEPPRPQEPAQGPLLRALCPAMRTRPLTANALNSRPGLRTQGQRASARRMVFTGPPQTREVCAHTRSRTSPRLLSRPTNSPIDHSEANPLERSTIIHKGRVISTTCQEADARARDRR